MKLGGLGDPMPCNANDADLSINWSQIMQPTSPGNPYSYQNTWNWNYGSAYGGGSTGTLQGFVNSFNNSLNSSSGNGWAVSQAPMTNNMYVSDPLYDDFHKMVRIWVFDPDTTFVLNNGYLSANKTLYFTDYFLNPNAGCRWQVWNYGPGASTYMPFGYNEFLFVNAASITYPSDYTGAPIPSEYVPPVPTYVAMGDSFSSGEGNSSYLVGTDTNLNTCHRSNYAYPMELRRQLPQLKNALFVACSGAITGNVLYGDTLQSGADRLPQVSALSTETDVVTITIGGNDVHFKELAEACFWTDCSVSSTTYGNTMSAIDDELPDKLDSVISTIKAEVSLSTEIYVGGYPHLAPAHMPSTGCFPLLLNSTYVLGFPETSNGYAVRQVVTQLNHEILMAVLRSNDTRVHFVDPNLPDSPFEGKDLCSNNPYFNNVVLANAEHSFHPNVAGQNAYSEVFESYIN